MSKTENCSSRSPWAMASNPWPRFFFSCPRGGFMASASCRSQVHVALVFCLSGYLYFAQPGRQKLWTEPQTGTVTLGGWVHAEYGQAIPAGVSVRLETNEGMVGGEQAVNTSGYFEFLG